MGVLIKFSFSSSMSKAVAFEFDASSVKHVDSMTPSVPFLNDKEAVKTTFFYLFLCEAETDITSEFVKKRIISIS